nr:hypothetical protein [Tanacetum cinerariifolium]
MPLNLRADEAVNQEKGDRVERAITTDASSEAAHDSDNMTMPNVEIPKRIDTGGRPGRQDTIGGTSAQTRSERVLEQPNEPPLPKGHTSGSGEGRLEENIKLTDTVPTPHESPLIGGDTPGSDEGRTTIAELMEACTILSNMVTQLDTELSTTKDMYNKAFITLTNKDFPKQGRIIEEMDKDENINLFSEQGEVQETAEHSRNDDDETLAKTLLNIKRSSAKDKGK